MEATKVVLICSLFVSSLFSAQQKEQKSPTIQTYNPDLYKDQQLVGKDISVEKVLLSPRDQIDLKLNKLKSDPVLRYAQWGFAVYDPATKNIITSYNENTPFIPASTTKLLTTETAYSLFGTDYHWNTQLEYSGEINENGVLNGNLYIIGSGDPSLGTNQAGASSTWMVVNKFKNALKDAGIKKITGDIITETGVFKESKGLLPPTIVWLEHNNYYLPIGSTKNINPQNEKLVVKTSSPMVKATKYFYISPYTNKVVYAEKFDGNEAIEGKLPDAPAYLANNFRASLIKSGISVGAVRSRVLDPNPENRILLTNEKSPSLEELVYFTNQTSNNRMAEAFLKIAGFFKNGDYSLTSGRATVGAHLFDSGFDFTGLSYADGSGLSRDNKVTPISHVKFLADLMTKPYFKSYFNSLPIAGNSGTLKRMFVYTTANGQIFAKTGTLNRVKTLAGYIKTRTGKTLTFSLLINNYSGSVDQVKRKMEELLEPTLQL